MPRDLRSLPEANDPLLRPYLAADDEASGARELARLLDDVARPVIRGVLSRTFGGAPLRQDDLDDLEAGVLLRVVQKLQSVAAGRGDAVRKLDDYVARLTYNAVADLRRAQSPEWSRLKKRLRYALSSDARLASWDGPAGTLCGLARWHGRTDAVQPAPLLAAGLEALRPAEALVRLFERAGGPMLLDAVTTLLAGAGDVHEEPAAEQTDPAALYESREQLQIVWEEIRALPPQQRTALLLNLRDAVGLNALIFFPLTQVATLDDIAGAAGLSTARLTQLWDRLPLADDEIGEILGATRQQVINFRKAARFRLQRRLGKRQETGRR